MDTVNSPLIRNHLLFGNKKKNLTFSTFFNKGFKYCNSNKVINIEEDNIKIYEGYSEEELKIENEDNNLNHVIKIENTDTENLKNSENKNSIKEEVKEEEKKKEEKKEENKEEEKKEEKKKEEKKDKKSEEPPVPTLEPLKFDGYCVRTIEEDSTYEESEPKDKGKKAPKKK